MPIIVFNVLLTPPVRIQGARNQSGVVSGILRLRLQVENISAQNH